MNLSSKDRVFGFNEAYWNLAKWASVPIVCSIFCKPVSSGQIMVLVCVLHPQLERGTVKNPLASGMSLEFLWCSWVCKQVSLLFCIQDHLLFVVTFTLSVCCAVGDALMCLQSPWLSLCLNGLYIFLFSNRDLIFSPFHNGGCIRFEFWSLLDFALPWIIEISFWFKVLFSFPARDWCTTDLTEFYSQYPFLVFIR